MRLKARYNEVAAVSRVNVQLIDAESGNHLWAERFDKPVADLFDVQDEIVSRLANTLTSRLVEVEAQRAERSPHPDATDLYFQGGFWQQRDNTRIHDESAQLFRTRPGARSQKYRGSGRHGKYRFGNGRQSFDRRRGRASGSS